MSITIFKLALNHTMGWPQRLEIGERQLVINIYFGIREKHLSFAMCFMFANIMLGLESDNSAQNFESKGLESKHLILITWFIFSSFLK